MERPLGVTPGQLHKTTYRLPQACFHLTQQELPTKDGPQALADLTSPQPGSPPALGHRLCNRPPRDTEGVVLRQQEFSHPRGSDLEPAPQ